MLLISSLSYTAVFFVWRKKVVYKKVRCIYCGNADVIKYGKSSGKQRLKAKGCGKIFEKAMKAAASETPLEL